ncbi:hypothetical protein BYT27DRAFT_7220110 [Phlegmacium glaucopus]|nr:hypothetical protein BYT27DRAFT_7220110 [Phlegmacium glaucopus]
MNVSSHSTVLGKRKAARPVENFVLYLNSGHARSASQDEQSEPDFNHSKPHVISKTHIIVNGSLVSNTKKCYQCTYKGCEKAYAKPSRLEEHERSHTGHRPFVCQTCNKSYLRDTHLHAHARSHLPESMKPFVCEKPSCTKRFWTSQHLRVHHSWHDGEKPYKCSELDCVEAFAKHHQLRAHTCAVHAPPGTKPFICRHNGCTKSFDTNQHLRTHQKIHDDKRYTCVHIDCMGGANSTPTFFSTWSALQSHIRIIHPPTCLHPSCNGRTFATQGNLRAHMKLHDERETELQIEATQHLGQNDEPLKKKRRGGDQGRDWQCDVLGCDNDFKSKKALTTHINVTHLGKRDFICHHPECNQAFGYKHLLQRHLAKAHPSTQSELDSSSSGDEIVQKTGFDIDTITGEAYAKRAEELVKSAKSLRCPYPHLQSLTVDLNLRACMDSSSSRRNCDYVFSRSYDLRRHLSASHDVNLPKETIDEWVKLQKQNRSNPL